MYLESDMTLNLYFYKFINDDEVDSDDSTDTEDDQSQFKNVYFTVNV